MENRHGHSSTSRKHNIMTILLGNTNASNFNKDERGNVIGSPLTLAARYGHVDISKLLVSSTIYW
jgi:hypothetical protein